MINNSLYSKKILHDKYYPEVIAYYFREWDKFDMPAHSHDQVEIMYVIKGMCFVGVDGNTIPMKNGSLILIDAGVPHTLLVNGKERCRMLNIEFVFKKGPSVFPSIKELVDQEPCLWTLFELNNRYVLLKDPEEVYPSLKGLIMELTRDSDNSKLLKKLLIAQVLINISRLIQANCKTEIKSGIIYVKKAIRYMQNNYDYDIRVENIASAINIHPGYLHRIFKSNTCEHLYWGVGEAHFRTFGGTILCHLKLLLSEQEASVLQEDFSQTFYRFLSSEILILLLRISVSIILTE